MSRPGNQNKKKRFEKYKSSGRREANKIVKQQRDEKRKARFSRRKEEGKAYEYKPIPFEKGSKEYNKEARVRSEKNQSHKTEYQTVTSILQRLQNDLDRIAREEKLMADKATKGKGKRRQSSLNNNGAQEEEIEMY